MQNEEVLSEFGGVTHSFAHSFAIWKWNCECPGPSKHWLSKWRHVCPEEAFPLQSVVYGPPVRAPTEDWRPQQISLVLRAQEPVAQGSYGQGSKQGKCWCIPTRKEVLIKTSIPVAEVVTKGDRKRIFFLKAILFGPDHFKIY